MEIQELKQRLSIIDVAKALGIQIGKNQRALCPFHDDKTPSLQFSKEKNIATCFSSNCNLGTVDIIGLTERKLNLSTHEALKYLSQLAGETKPISETKQPPATEPEIINQPDILKQVFTYFENALLNSKPAKDYCKQRNLDYQKLQIGYNTGTYHHNNKEQILPLEILGLLKKINSGHSSFGKGCIVFPLKNRKGETTGLYFREANGDKANKHYYLKNRQGLYPNYPKPETTKLLIPESIIDTATLQQIQSITEEYELLSSYGTNGITEEHKAAIKEWAESPPSHEATADKKIILFFDGDEAGRTGAATRAEELHKLLPKVKISQVETPENEDVNNLSIGHTLEIFTELLNNRKPFLFSVEKTSNEENKAVQTKGNVSPPVRRSLDEGGSATITPKQDTGLNTHNPYKIIYPTPNAIYYIKGSVPKVLDSMRVTIEIENISTGRKSRQRFDLYEDKQTEKAAREAAEKLNLRADLLELDLNYLTDLLDNYREAELMEKQKETGKEKVIVPAAEQAGCIDFMSKLNLIQRFNELIGKAGITGEENNRVFLFTIGSSYKMPDTLHALVQGSSGSGKTYLIKIISSLMPPEDVIRLTRVTENSFYNYGEYELQYKLIVIEDTDGLKEEAEFAFRELQSNEILSSSTSLKNENGHIQGTVRIVRGPIGSLATTTRGEMYQDNMSRVFIIAVDESQGQTEKIIRYQNQKATGIINKNEEAETKRFIQNCIRMLKPYEVINPYADKILLPMEADTIRRLTNLFHAFINQITIINQYQRKKDPHGRLITEKEDVKNAIDIMFDSIVLKVDELDGSLRQFYEQLKQYIQSKGQQYKDYQFTQREIRHALNIKKTRLSYYINELLELEYIIQSGYANRGYSYKITWWDSLQALRERIKKYLYGQLNNL